LAAAQRTGTARRAFQAERTRKYCHGSARLAETLLGWSRKAVEVGVAERHTGIECVDGHAAWRGRKRWEEKSAAAQLPSPSTRAEVLNRRGYRLRQVLKAKPQKKIPEPDAIFANRNKRPGPSGYPRGHAVEPRR